jgi:hypothetical protein
MRIQFNSSRDDRDSQSRCGLLRRPQRCHLVVLDDMWVEGAIGKQKRRVVGRPGDNNRLPDAQARSELHQPFGTINTIREISSGRNDCSR